MDLFCTEPKTLMDGFLYSLEVAKKELKDIPIIRDSWMFSMKCKIYLPIMKWSFRLI